MTPNNSSTNRLLDVKGVDEMNVVIEKNGRDAFHRIDVTAKFAAYDDRFNFLPRKLSGLLL